MDFPRTLIGRCNLQASCDELGAVPRHAGSPSFRLQNSSRIICRSGLPTCRGTAPSSSQFACKLHLPIKVHERVHFFNIALL